MEVPAAVTTIASTALEQNNRKLVWKLLLVVALSGCFGFALVPLYDVICRITGLNGRTNAVAIVPNKNTQIDTSRLVNVEFLTHTMPGVGLEFAPEQFTMKVHPGEVIHTNYVVRNNGNETFVGQAIPSVTPAVSAPYFEKIECFCFNQQTFKPGEVRTMPVVFVINPEMSRDLGTITLSYTFFEAPKVPG
jgi:cytochrome c oxidase assembly protein subunit 11